jgi:hypothetical protein
MKHLSQSLDKFRAQTLGPGLVALVAVAIDRAHMHDERPKVRPLVLVDTPPNRPWRAAALTTSIGDPPRPAIEDWASAGLTAPTYLWSRNLVIIDSADVRGSIGRLSRRDWEMIREETR